MNAAVPRDLHLARELIIRAKAADEHWGRLARARPDDQPIIGQGRHADHTNAEVLSRAIADYGVWPDAPLMGKGGARAAWRIALRADTRLDLQKAAVGLPPADLALQRLRDRLAAEPCLDAEEYGDAPTAVLVGAA